MWSTSSARSHLSCEEYRLKVGERWHDAPTTQAQRDSAEALAIILEYCNTPELQREAIRALEFKCDVLWSMLDAIDHAYGAN